MLVEVEAALIDDPKRAERLSRALARDAAGWPDAHLRAEVLTVRAAALLQLNRVGEGRLAAEEATALSPDSADAWSQAALAAYRAGDMAAASIAFEEAVGADPDGAEAWHGLGRAATWAGDPERAAVAFATAARLDPESFVVPIRIAAVEFQRIATQVWRSIPDRFAARLTNAIVAVEELPAIEEVASGLDPDVLGLYEGGTALDDEWFERILLYQRNHEAICATLGELHEEVRQTILHEVGHHFGMEDGELPY